jgi:hypothetical protein
VRGEQPSINQGRCVPPAMTPEQAISFIRDQGVVLASARGPAPRLAELVAGGPIRGSWWAHPDSHRIFQVFKAVAESDDILMCRLVGGKISFVHRRLWPALVCVASRFAPGQLAMVRQEHTASGRHVNHEIAFPKWVPQEVLAAARDLDEHEALESLGTWALGAVQGGRNRMGTQ